MTGFNIKYNTGLKSVKETSNLAKYSMFYQKDARLMF